MPRPTRYATKTPAPSAVAAALAFQAPPAGLDPMPVEDQGNAVLALPGSDRPADERDLLLVRIADSRAPVTTLCKLVLEIDGPDCLTTETLRRMVSVLDVISGPPGSCNP
jgi:hypothetical protein